MAQYVEEDLRTFLAGSALGQHLRVTTIGSGQVGLAGAGDCGIGTTENVATFTNEPLTVRLLSATGTRKVVANGAITEGSQLYCAASGKVSSTGTIPYGICLESSTADNDVIEAFFYNCGSGGVQTLRQRVTIADVNAGLTLLPAAPNRRYRLVDVAVIAIGGAAGAVTTVDILGTQSAVSVKLLAAAQANLTQSTLLRAGATGGTILADGASFAQCDTNTAITIGKTGSNVTTATHIDVILNYVVV